MAVIEIYGYDTRIEEKSAEAKSVKTLLEQVLRGTSGAGTVVRIMSPYNQSPLELDAIEPHLRISYASAEESLALTGLLRFFTMWAGVVDRSLNPPVTPFAGARECLRPQAPTQPKRQLSQEEAGEVLRNLRPVAGTDPDFDYERGVLKQKPDAT